MKVVCAILIIAILLKECPRGYWKTFDQQRRCLWRDLKDSLAVRVSIVFLSIFLLDSFLLATIQSVENPIGLRLIRLGGSVGSNVNFWLMMIAVWLITKALRKKNWSRIWLGAIFSAAVTGLVCNVFKIFGLRSRPQAGHGPMSFFNVDGYLEHKGLFMSFSSGDVALVAGAAGFLFYFAKDIRVKLCIVAVPLLTAASRIYLNRHWPSDTLLSVALGLVIGHYLYRTYKSVYTDYSQLPMFFRVHRPLLLSGKNKKIE